MSIYTWFLNLFGWKAFVAKQPDNIRPLAQDFYVHFNKLGSIEAISILIGISLIIVLLYYYPFNGKTKFGRHFHFRLGWWVGALVVNVLATGLFTWAATVITFRSTLNYQFDTSAYFLISFINALYSIILFVAFSYIITRLKKGKFASNASCTPFKLKNK